MVIAMLFGMLIVPTSIYAEKDLQDIQKERQEVKAALTDAEKEIANLLIEMKEIDEAIQLLDETLKENQQQIEKTEAEIKETKAEIKILEDKIEQRFEILKDRAKSYQANGGNIRFLDVLFNAEDFSDFISRVSAITQITNADAELIEKQEADKKLVEEKLDDMKSLQEELEVIKANIEEQKEGIVEQKEVLADKKTELNTKVNKLKIKDDELKDLRSKLLIQEQGSTGGGSTAFSSAANMGDGQFAWPTEGGYMSSPMGTRWGKMHKGMDIARTDRSTSPPIYAAEKGTVESAGFNNGGYGNMVIINHGNGLKTLYAHMNSLAVSSGQTVKRGQQIGVMGQTGDSQGIHLHFEVHLNGGLQNPVSYLR
jgi:murein DD-endopeptidase MepM/ murein hydrolase activator NlpD